MKKKRKKKKRKRKKVNQFLNIQGFVPHQGNNST